MESQCVSINIGPLINGKGVCELSNSDDKSHSEDLKAKVGFTYRATQVRKQKPGAWLSFNKFVHMCV